MLKFLRSCAKGQWGQSNLFINNLLNPTDAVGANVLYWQSLRAAQALHAAGRKNDARWTLDFLCHKIPVRMSIVQGTIPTVADSYPLRNPTDRERAHGIAPREKHWTSYSQDERSIRGVEGV